VKKYIPLFILSFVSALLFSTSVFAEIYKWVDKDGKTHFGDDKEVALEVKTEATVPEVVELKKANAYTETKPSSAELERRQIEESEKNKQGTDDTSAEQGR
jgi:hypothetical protein